MGGGAQVERHTREPGTRQASLRALRRMAAHRRWVTTRRSSSSAVMARLTAQETSPITEGMPSMGTGMPSTMRTASHSSSCMREQRESVRQTRLTTFKKTNQRKIFLPKKSHLDVRVGGEVSTKCQHCGCWATRPRRRGLAFGSGWARGVLVVEQPPEHVHVEQLVRILGVDDLQDCAPLPLAPHRRHAP